MTKTVRVVFACALTSSLAHAEPAPEPVAPPALPPSAPATEPLPDPATFHQEPAPVRDRAPAVGPMRYIEVGFAGGATSRPATAGAVHYGVAPTLGMHARVDLLKWLGARVMARWESVPVTFDSGALGLPPGTLYDQPDLQRVYLGGSLEPTWYPTPRLALYAGAGIGWGRTTADPLHTSGAERVSLPIRSAVFVEVPLSLGVRYEIVENWVVLNLSGHVGILSKQSGALENPYDTPGKSGTEVTAAGFPELGTSVGVLGGVGCIL